MRLALVMSHADRRMAGARRELHLLRGLAARGAAVTLFRMHAGPAIEREDFLAGTVPAVFCPADENAPVAGLRLSATLVAEIAAFRPTVLLFKGLGYHINQQVTAALPGCPFILIPGGRTTDPLLDRAALVLAEHARQEAVDFAGHASAGRTMVLPKFFDPALAGDGQPDPAPRYAVVNVGAFVDARKNQAALLPLTARHRVCFVGGGAMLETVRAQAPARNLARFAGHRRPDDVYRFILAAQLMAHVSTNDGLPRAVVEAMACGRPVIGYRDVIAGAFTHGEHGLLVAPDELEASVETLLADPPRLAAMGAAARAHAFAHHGPDALDRAAAALLDLLRRHGIG